MVKRRAAFVAIVDDDDDDDADKITAYCERCKDLGFYYKLGSRIYPKDEPNPYDADKWLQCPNCGQVTPRVYAKQENEITPIVDPPDTIHDSNKVVAIATNHQSKSRNRSRAILDHIKKNR